MTSELTGPRPRPLRVLAQGRDAAGQYVRAGLQCRGARAVVIGSDTIPMVIRRATSGAVTFALDTHVAVGKFAAAGTAATLQDVTLALRSAIAFGGKSRPITLNPAKDTALTNTVAMQACAPARLRDAAADDEHRQRQRPPAQDRHSAGTAVGHVRLSLLDRRRRPAGDQVALQGLSKDGLVEARGSADVRPDGSFLIRTTLRSAFSDDGDLVLPARGRYGVASTEGGNATVYGIATEDTHVALAQPRLVLQRKPGNKLHFAIRVPGGDQHVRVTIKLGSEDARSGLCDSERPVLQDDRQALGEGELRAVASVPGADTAFSLPTTFSQ